MFAATSLIALAIGVLISVLSGVPQGVWIRNPAAWLLGALAAVALARFAGGKVIRAVPVVALLGLFATLAGEGQQGVHRWLEIGPLRLNAAMLLLPPLVVSLVLLTRRSPIWWVSALAAMGVLAWQPDASQASALAVALALLASASPREMRRPAWLAVAAATGLAGVAWTRPDPLAPVAEVEEVIGLAAGLSAWLAAAAVLSLAAVSAGPALVGRRDGRQASRTAGLALGGLLAAWSLAPALGAFPVPIVGVGPSPIVGAWLGIGLLAAIRRMGPAERNLT